LSPQIYRGRLTAVRTTAAAIARYAWTMGRWLVLFAALALGAAPAAQAAAPSVAFKRQTLLRSAAGTQINVLPRERGLQFDVRYVVRGVPARWKNATAQVFVTLIRGTDALRFQTRRAQTETGTWRWVVKGSEVLIPAGYPAGRYKVRVRVVLRHGGKQVARVSHERRATVR
jgi:hypothetical protein